MPPVAAPRAAAAPATATAEGTHEEFDAVIMATGFRHRLADFLPAELALLGHVASVEAAMHLPRGHATRPGAATSPAAAVTAAASAAEAVAPHDGRSAAAPLEPERSTSQLLPLVDGRGRSTVRPPTANSNTQAPGRAFP